MLRGRRAIAGGTTKETGEGGRGWGLATVVSRGCTVREETGWVGIEVTRGEEKRNRSRERERERDRGRVMAAKAL